MEYKLPYPPSVNTYWRAFRGRMIISRNGRLYRERVAAELKLSDVVKPLMLTCALKLTVAVYPPDNRRRDLDNVLKAILDALAYAGVYADDSQVQEIHIRREYVEAPGRVVVSVEAI